MSNNDMHPLHDSLSEREQAIFRLLAEGRSDRQIAQEVFLSLNTVKWYNRQIYSKVGVSSRTQAIAQAKSLSLLGEGSSVSPLLPVPPHNLPAQSTPFIGHRREMEAVEKLLECFRLLMLTDSGGTGKTRFVHEEMKQMQARFISGVKIIYERKHWRLRCQVVKKRGVAAALKSAR